MIFSPSFYFETWLALYFMSLHCAHLSFFQRVGIFMCFKNFLETFMCLLYFFLQYVAQPFCLFTMLGRSYFQNMEYLCHGDESMLQRIPSVGIAVICGVYVSFDLGSMKNLSTVITKLDKTQHKISCICRRFMPSIDMALVGHLIFTQGTCYLHFNFLR